ncbi:hypothetical protein ACTHQ2_25690, partial [Bacillus subtilis]|uniref:hypothetical protein n=1 Tax=Bacillus subtilis TaxID=1423 RepID=UPI003F7B7BE2
VCRPEADQHERTIETLRKIYDAAPDKVRIVINAIHSNEQVQPLRVAFEEFGIKAPIYYMPYAREETQDLKTLPVFKDVKKSKYSAEFRGFLKDIGVSSAALVPKTSENEQEPKSSNGILGIFKRRAN